MGVRPSAKTERNQEIYNKLQSGVSYKELMQEYDVNHTRIYAIKRQVERKNQS